MPPASNLQPAQTNRRFVILAAPRSGSNMLCTMLDSHPSVLCHHEIYNPKGIRLAVSLRETGFTLGTVTDRDGNPEAFLERIWSRQPGVDCVGFKFTHRQNETVYRRLLADPGIAKIVLRRKNRMKTYVSQKISERLSEWEVYRRQDLIQTRPRVTIDPRLFLQRVAFDDAYYAEIREAMRAGGQSWIEVLYEELFSLDTQHRVVQFLGLEPAANGLKIGSIKQNACDLRDLIANYDELCRYFADTEFETELLDVGH